MLVETSLLKDRVAHLSARKKRLAAELRQVDTALAQTRPQLRAWRPER